MSVYVVQQPDESKNILSASNYGELVFVLPDKRNIMFSPQPTIAKIRKALEDFNDDDYLLLIGDPVAIGVATHVALANNRGKAKLLKWDNREFLYYPVEIKV